MKPDTNTPIGRTANGLAALAHPARLAILNHLAQERECCCRDVVEQFDLAQSTVSQHLKVLVDAGLVRLRSVGGRSRYAVDGPSVSCLASEIQCLLAGCCAEDKSS